MAGTIHYWPIKARNVAIELVAAQAGIKLTRNEPAWPEFKPQTHFGQLPFVEIGTTKVSQSLAIVRVLSRMGGLAGATDADFALSEMLIQEAEDIYLSLSKAMYGPGYPASRPDAFAAIFAPGGYVTTQVKYLEALVTPGGDFTTAPTAGEAAVMGVLCIISDLEPIDALLAHAPKLHAFYSKRAASAGAVLAGLKPYFRRDAGEDSD